MLQSSGMGLERKTGASKGVALPFLWIILEFDKMKLHHWLVFASPSLQMAVVEPYTIGDPRFVPELVDALGIRIEPKYLFFWLFGSPGVLVMGISRQKGGELII